MPNLTIDVPGPAVPSPIDASPRVLIVDDDAPLIRMLRLAMRDCGYRVDAEVNGRDALDHLHRTDADVIVLDLEMPVMDGREFYRALRAAGNRAPVLVLSAFDARRGQRELGADAYLNKPFNPVELTLKIRDLLHGRR